MTSRAIRPLPRRIHVRPLRRPGPRRPVRDNRLLSLAGIIHAPVYDTSRSRIVGLLDDLVVDVGRGAYPLLVGAIVRLPVGRAYLPTQSVLEILPQRLVVAGPSERGVVPWRPGLVALARDVLDRQIIDVDGANVERVSDLVLGRRGNDFYLVGVDVSIRTLLRRIGPRRLRQRVAPERVYDWTAVAAFSKRASADAASVLHLTESATELRRRGPADLDRLIGDLPPHERAQLGEHRAASS